jgi:hypothetical protein
LSNDATELRKFRFLAQWAELSTADKHDKYNRFNCHEVNVFLYMKDPDFFASVIRPILASRLKKVRETNCALCFVVERACFRCFGSTV